MPGTSPGMTSFGTPLFHGLLLESYSEEALTRLPDGQITCAPKFLSSNSFPIFRNKSLPVLPKSPAYIRHPVLMRGALAIVTNVGRVAVDAAALCAQVVAGQVGERPVRD